MWMGKGACGYAAAPIKLPIIAIQNGMVEGRFIPKIRPVTIAERSPTVCGFLKIKVHKNSKSIAEAVVTAKTAAERQPKITQPKTAAGKSAIITSSIIP